MEDESFGKENVMENGASSYRRFLEGDESGIVDIIRDYKDGLMLYMNQFVKNIHIAEDLTEDCFVRLVVKRPKFKGKSSFKTWLYSIGRNLAIDYIRHNSKTVELSDEDYNALLIDEKNIETEYIKEEQRLVVHNTLRKIKDEYSQVLYLSFFEDLSNKEISIVMKKSKRQIENLLYRAKLSLKNELDKEGFYYEKL